MEAGILYNCKKLLLIFRQIKGFDFDFFFFLEVTFLARTFGGSIKFTSWGGVVCFQSKKFVKNGIAHMN